MKVLSSMISSLSIAGIIVGTLYTYLPAAYARVAYTTGSLPITLQLERKVPGQVLENKIGSLKAAITAIRQSRKTLLSESEKITLQISEYKKYKYKNELILDNARKLYHANPNADEYEINGSILSSQNFSTEIELIDQLILTQSTAIENLGQALNTIEKTKISLSRREHELLVEQRTTEASRTRISKYYF